MCTALLTTLIYFRIEVFRKEIERLECEKECQTFLLHKKSETFANGKLLLKSAVGPDLFHIVDAYIEVIHNQNYDFLLFLVVFVIRTDAHKTHETR